MDADAYNARELGSGRITPQHLTTLTRMGQVELGLVEDGRCGPATQLALAEARTEAHTPTTLEPISEPPDQRTDVISTFGGPLDAIPRTRREVYQTFGDPGTAAKPRKEWRRSNILEVRDLPGVPRRWYVQVHRLAEPYLREGLRRSAIVTPDVKIARLGCHVMRHIRHDPARPLSLHSWGIAVDINPEDNTARQFTRGAGPAPWSEEWRKLWPRGIPQGFVEAMESVGWTWGGVWGASGRDLFARARACSLFDPMHFELRGR